MHNMAESYGSLGSSATGDPSGVSDKGGTLILPENHDGGLLVEGDFVPNKLGTLNGGFEWIPRDVLGGAVRNMEVHASYTCVCARAVD